jgi:hypothetical protein
LRACDEAWLARRTWHALLLAVAIAGCASTPQAATERDAEAKQFNARPDAATIYVYRDDFQGPSDGDNTVLFVNGRLIGATLPRTFFRLDERAGEHELHGLARDHGRLRVDARYGEITFVSLQAVGGVSHFTLVEPETGRQDILRCCWLMENWAPGQRPLPLLR